MSSTKIAQFSLFIGLNLINPLYSINQIQPAHLYADKLDSVPSWEFYEIINVRDALYLAGSGLYRLENGEFETLLSSGRYTALCYEASDDRIWYAGPEGIGYITEDTVQDKVFAIEMGYIWNLILTGNRLWYFGSAGYGWIDTKDQVAGKEWRGAFKGRPNVFCPAGAETCVAYVADERGLYVVTPTGLSLVVPESAIGGNVISWMAGIPGDYYFGTVEAVYSWTGVKGALPEAMASNYDQFFEKGLNNAVQVNRDIAITDYPYGVAVWDIEKGVIDGYADLSSGLAIGDVFKLAPRGDGSLLAMGMDGVAEVDMEIPHRFFPAKDLWKDDTYQGVITRDEEGFVFTDKNWIRISGDFLMREPLQGYPSWITLDGNRNIVTGYVNSYDYLDEKGWHQTLLSEPLFDLSWGTRIGYAVGQDGFYAMDDAMRLELVYPSDGRLYLLEELNGILYIRDVDGSIRSLEYTGTHWLEKEHPGFLGSPPLHTAVDKDRILIANESGLFSLNPTSVQTLPVEAGWEIRGMGSCRDLIYTLMYNPSKMETAVCEYAGEESRMLVVPYLDRIGEPFDLMCTDSRLGLVGEDGIGWFALDELESIDTPQVVFSLLFDGEVVKDRTLPSGMQFIDLQIADSHPEVPKQIQYRINEQRWRNVDIEDPSLQIAGHGHFSVELRALHPNGTTTDIQLVQFGIAPPWYLNPYYQVMLLVVAIAFVWMIYLLRHRQLKKTNLWLEAEVRKQTRELEAATEARTNFLAGLSHDIRNPLNGVLMIAEALSRDPPQTTEDARLQDLKEFGIIVDRMLGEILDFSAIDQTSMSTGFVPVSIADILRSSVSQNQFNIQRQMINMQITLPRELEAVIVKTDRNWMIKILANLIVNAIEYSESERIEVGARNYYLTEKEIDLEIYVKDWGCGIDDSEKHLVFDRFYRGERGIESGKHGTGLGLSICQDIAHAMGAHLLLEDTDPSGSTFILRGRFERVEGATELDVDAVLSSLKGKRVLVVDDLDYNRKSIVDFLSTMGCHCDQSGNGREALEMLGQHTYDLALLDWDLPGMMGPDISRAYRKDHPEDSVVIIALTAYTEVGKKNLSAKAGMNGYISKPLTASRLAHCLANVTDHQPEKRIESDRIDQDELFTEVRKHIEECIHLGETGEWEDLRRCAHRLTTLALSLDNKPMQHVCRDLQIAAQSANSEEVHIGLADLRQWRNL